MTKARFSGVSALIFDIEGTVAPIAFVKDTLFPYALKTLPFYLAANWEDQSFQDSHLASFPAEARTSPDAFQAHVYDLTKRDVKAGYLKSLQGALWRSGYQNGELVTPLFDDVVPRLEHWRNDVGIKKLAIFSSGSVQAQKLFFGHVGTSDGGKQDLRPLFEPYWFDTVNAGNKFEKSSYEKIAAEMGIKAEDALFLSDHVKEVQAALDAGLKSALIVRPGNPPQDAEEHIAQASSLDDVEVQVQA